MATNLKSDVQTQAPTRAQELFRGAPTDYKELIRSLLREERDVMHLKRRSDIHQRLYDHIKRVIK
jgi:hypothetical protein